MPDTGRRARDESPLRVLGIGGSMRLGSKSRVLLRGALDIAAASGADVTLADVRENRLPLFDDDMQPDTCPPDLMELLAAARG